MTLKKCAFVFPGQGSQSVGMLRDLSTKYPLLQKTFEEASELLGWDTWNLVANGPAESLDQTENTQPILLTASIAIWRIWCSHRTVRPVLLAGHSVGEYSALVCAESLSFHDALRLTQARGKCMQQAVPNGVGAMAAVLGLADEVVEEICAAQSKPEALVACANYNCPGQVVIAGHTTAVETAMTSLKNAGAKLIKRLPVSVPSHTFLMKKAASLFEKSLNNICFRKPVIAVINNADLEIYEDESRIREGLFRQLFSPVRWTETIHKAKQAGIEIIYECGPGKVLTSLNKRIDKSLQAISLEQPEAFEPED